MKNLTNSERLRIILGCLFVGFFCGRFPALSGIFFVGGFFCIVLVWQWRSFVALCICAVLLGVGYGSYRLQLVRSDSFAFLAGQNIEMTGTVTSFPDVREHNTRAFFSGTIDSYEGTVLLVVPPSQDLQYGQRLTIRGRLKLPETFEDFDYARYLERFGATALVRTPKIVVEGTEGGWWLLRLGQRSRAWLAENLQKNLPLVHQKIAMGILLGVKEELPEKEKRHFQRSGLMHILVVSGFNVSVVMLLITFLFRRFGRRIVFGATLGGLLFFLALTGADPPVLRAACMGGVVGWALSLGRTTDTRNVFVLTLVLLGLFNPLMIQRDMGFFLSTLATAGILFGVPYLESFLSFIPWKLLRTLLSVTLSAQIAVFPILILAFGEFPLVGVLANLFTEPIIPVSMGASTIVAFLGGVPSFVAKIISIPAVVCLELLIQIATFFSRFPVLQVDKNWGWFFLVPVVGFLVWEMGRRACQGTDDSKQITDTS